MAKAKPPARTYDENARLLQGGESYWKAFHNKCKEAQNVYYAENGVGAPEVDPDNAVFKEPYELHMGRGAEIQDSFRGLVEAPSRITVPAGGLGARVKNRTEDLERFGNAYMPKVEFEQGADIESCTLFEVGLFGLTFVGVWPDASRWKGLYPKRGLDPETNGPLIDEKTGKTYEETDVQYVDRVDEWQQTAPMPVRIDHFSALESVPLMDGKRVAVYLRQANVPAVYVEARFREQLAELPDAARYLKELKPDQTVKLVQTADDTYCQWGVAAGGGGDWGANLKTWEHKMPLPEGQAPVVAYRGFTTSHPKPEKKYRGILDNIIEPLMGMDFLASRLATEIGIYFWLTLIHKVKEGGTVDPATLKKLRKFYFGGLNHLAENETLEVLGPPGNLPDANILWERLEERLRMHWSPALQGILEGKSSGYAWRLIRQASLQKIGPVANSIAQGDADRFRMVCYAVGGLEKQLTPAQRQQPLRVYAHFAKDGISTPVGVTWDEVRPYLSMLEASRDPDMPQDELADLDAVGKAIELKMPRARAWKRYAGVDDPETMDEEYIGEQLEEQDPIMQARIARVLNKMDLSARDTFAEPTQTALAQPGLPPAFSLAVSPNLSGGAPDVPAQGVVGSGARAGQTQRPPTQPQVPSDQATGQGG